ncbi:uncharacterized protein LOC143466003 [Clavelina lepadiformis]|uniref:uncharacterized protein LOC143466003 n=1 Tax=Clavelina lepadiformis TaxID=159417 RepID=UPI0040425412
MKQYLCFVVLFVLCIKATCQVFNDDVSRNAEEDTPTNASEDGEGKNNSVVILGVTLSLSVIVAIAGIFIGLYFRVEQILRCCRKNNNQTEEVSKLETGDASWYGNDKSNNMFMTSATNPAFITNENLQTETTSEKKENDTSETKSAPNQHKKSKHKPFFPPSGKNKKKARSSMAENEEPVGFRATSTHVTGDGIIVCSPGANDDEMVQTARSKQTHHPRGIETGHKPFSTQQDDILF